MTSPNPETEIEEGTQFDPDAPVLWPCSSCGFSDECGIDGLCLLCSGDDGGA